MLDNDEDVCHWMSRAELPRCCRCRPLWTRFVDDDVHRPRLVVVVVKSAIMMNGDDGDDDHHDGAQEECYDSRWMET
jgi:hypothetical protein